jgi:Glyoxalase-like domain
MNLRIQCACIDTADPAGLAAFWESALGWRRTYEQDDQVVLEPSAGSPEDGIVPDLLFLRVPDSRSSGFPQRSSVGAARPLDGCGC